MQTIYDWLTVGIFCGLVTLYLHRLIDVEDPRDALWQYLVASAGCAGVNWLGNEGRHVVALLTLMVVLAFVHRVLAPFK